MTWHKAENVKLRKCGLCSDLGRYSHYFFTDLDKLEASEMEIMV